MLTNVSIADFRMDSLATESSFAGAFWCSTNGVIEGRAVSLSKSTAQVGGGNIDINAGARVVFTDSRFERLFERAIVMKGGAATLHNVNYGS